MIKSRTYMFDRIRNGVKEIGITSGETPEEALSHVTGSHPENYGVTYAMVYLTEEKDPNSDYTREWGKR